MASPTPAYILRYAQILGAGSTTSGGFNRFGLYTEEQISGDGFYAAQFSYGNDVRPWGTPDGFFFIHIGNTSRGLELAFKAGSPIMVRVMADNTKLDWQQLTPSLT